MENIPVTRKRLASLFLVALFVTGCRSTVSTSADDYVGEYVFKPIYTDPGDFASFVILRKDRTAIEIRFSKETGAVQTTEKKWSLSYTTGQNVGIGNFSHPVEGSRSTIKLGINEDLGQVLRKSSLTI